jgi:hypothetical protein
VRSRAARDFVNKNPGFALLAGLAAIRWLAEGYGFEITGADVWAAYSHTLKSGETQKATQFCGSKMAQLVLIERKRFERSSREVTAHRRKPLVEFIGYAALRPCDVF